MAANNEPSVMDELSCGGSARRKRILSRLKLFAPACSQSEREAEA